jgi:DNA-binding Lrp family transcriptional regulator
MAIRAYVFIECLPGKPIQVAEALAKVPGTETAHAVTGAYDVIAFVSVENMAALGELISQGIHRLPGVLKTTTNVVVEPTGRSGGTQGTPVGKGA